ncbi:MAG: stage III sporulation protein AE [Desulfitobacterium hafniense]|nr:stage III sporulation protein AE [Desulfitobacterium hafniense]
MRRLILFFLFFVLCWTTSPQVLAGSQDPQSLSGSSADIANQVDLSQVKGFLEKIDADVQSSLPGFSLARIFEDLKQGKLDLSPENIGKSLLKLLGNEILRNAPLIGKLLVLAVLCAILQQLQHSFGGSVGKMSQALTYLVLLGIALASFQIAVDVAKGAIEQMVGFMQTLFPVMLTLLLAMGNLTSAALFKPIVMGSLTFLATLIKTIILPIFFLSAVLKLFNNISEQFKLTKLTGLFEFLGKTSIGIVLTVFIGIMAIQGVTGGVADGVVLRTAKYSVDLIPVVGKAFKDAVELVVTSGLMVKNALGLVAMIAVAIICLGPIVKIIAMMFAFRVSAALIEPLGQKALADSLQDMAKSLIYIFGAVASVAVMFFITIAVVVGSGNLSIMLR